MSDTTALPDQIPGAPHPRDTDRLMGQTQAEAELLDALQSGRRHHAWLLTGPRGVGKATLAYRAAGFLIAGGGASAHEDSLFGAPPPGETRTDTLAIGPEHPVAQRMRTGAEPGLRTVTRSENDQGRLRADITVDDIRKLGGFFHLSATDGGHRVVIVDAADDMNTSAANALLKMLEEPPAATTLFLIAHRPARLLPTIRSRCRVLKLPALAPDDLDAALHQAGSDPGAHRAAVAELSGGSVGQALTLISGGGTHTYAALVAVMAEMPRMDRAAARALAQSAAGGRAGEDRLADFIALLDLALTRLARAGATGQAAPEAAPGEAQIFARLAGHPGAARLWAETAAEVTARLSKGRAVNLDPAALVLDTLFKLNDTARQAVAAHPALS